MRAAYFLALAITAAGCVHVQRFGDLRCEKRHSLFVTREMQCAVPKVPLRAGAERVFTILTTNWVPNALAVNLKGFRSPTAFKEALNKTVLRLHFSNESGETLLEKTLHLNQCRTQEFSGSDERILFEILKWSEYSDLLDARNYQIVVRGLRDGAGGKRFGEFVTDSIFLLPEKHVEISGEISRGKLFRRDFGAFEFVLEPIAFGWIIDVREKGQAESLARLTPPLHFAPNPRWIEGWDFTESAAASNAPQLIRSFVFSPEVGRSIQGHQSRTNLTGRELRRIGFFGRGDLQINELELSRGTDGENTAIERMRFHCFLQYRDSSAPR